MTDANEQLRRFHAWARGLGDGQYQPALAREVMQVASVTTDSNSAIVAVEGGLLQGDGAISEATFTLPMGGRAAAVGDYLLVGHDKTRAVGAELTYLGHTQSLYPGSGLVAVNANIPAPTFASPPSTTSIVKLPGSITAKMSVFFAAVPQVNPSGYTVSYRVDGGEWRDRFVPHIGGVQECDLGSDLPPSVDVDVHLRTVCAWSAQQSPPSADSTFATADDDSTPGSISALSVSVATPGQLSITPTASIDSDLLRGFIYYINDAATGTPDITSVPINGPWDAGVPPGTYYVAAVPISKSGTLGSRFPATTDTYQGPYVVQDQSANLDTTAPAGMGAPTLATEVVQFADNTWHGYMTVTLPAYTPPSDLSVYEVSIVVDDGRKWQEVIAAGDTSGRYEVGFGGFTVKVRARDQAGNAPTFGTAATTTIAAPVLSNTAPTVTTASVGAGIKISWGAITNALGYEIQRATDGSGTGATTIGTTDALWFVDPLLSDTIILPTYYYRVRPISMGNQAVVTGTYSAWTAGTVGAIDAQNLRVLSIVAGLIATDAITANKILAGAVTAAKLEADLLLATKIRTGTSGSRFEIEGHTGGSDQDQIRAYELISSTTFLRWILNAAGLTFYNDSGTADASFARVSGGRVQIDLQNLRLNSTGARIRTDVADLYLDQAVSGMGNWRLGYVKDEAGNDRLGLLVDASGIELLLGIDPGRGSGITSTNYLALSGFGIGFQKNGADAGTIWWDAANIIAASQRFRAASGLHAGAMPSYVDTWLATVYQSTALGDTSGDAQPLAAWQYNSANRATLRLSAFRGATIGTADWQEARFRFSTDIDNLSANGGGIDLGFKGYGPYFSLHTGGTSRLRWDDANTRVLVDNALHVTGALSKGSGTFTIPHPDPAKAGRDLRHSFVESPTRGDNLYRFAVLVSRDEADGASEHRMDLPDYWPWLNEDGQCWCQGRRHFGQMWAEVADDGRALTWCANAPGWYNILLIGTRKDAVAVAGWDATGGIEPESRTTPPDVV